MVQEIEYRAPRGVAEAVAGLGRTEDLRFSPSRRRLAVAQFGRNRVAVFGVDITSSPGGTHVALTSAVELSSPALDRPHGVDFIDDDTLIVTSRGSDVAVFGVPADDKDVRCHEVLPTARWPAGRATHLRVPGSVSVVRAEDDVCEVLVCNNAGHTVTRHLLDRKAGGAVRTSDVLLQRYLDIPDGVAVSPDRRWIAVSNHNTHNVLVYENTPGLSADAEPDGILRRVYYPHGLCFSADGRHLFVADAGAPYLRIYAQDPDGWRGVRHPVASVRVMDEPAFERGRHNREEGGPKGVDVAAHVLVVTSECQPLAFFDVSALLRDGLERGARREQESLDVGYELALMRESQQMARRVAEARGVLNSRSWRLTAPLRRLNSIFRRRG